MSFPQWGQTSVTASQDQGNQPAKALFSFIFLHYHLHMYLFDFIGCHQLLLMHSQAGAVTECWEYGAFHTAVLEALWMFFTAPALRGEELNWERHSSQTAISTAALEGVSRINWSSPKGLAALLLIMGFFHLPQLQCTHGKVKQFVTDLHNLIPPPLGWEMKIEEDFWSHMTSMAFQTGFKWFFPYSCLLWPLNYWHFCKNFSSIPGREMTELHMEPAKFRPIHVVILPTQPCV